MARRKYIFAIFVFIVVMLIIYLVVKDNNEREEPAESSRAEISLSTEVESSEISEAESEEESESPLKAHYNEKWIPLSAKTELSSQDIESLKTTVDVIAKQIMSDNQTKIFSICYTAPDLKDKLLGTLAELDVKIASAQGKYNKLLDDIIANNGVISEKQKTELESYVDEIIDCSLGN